MKFCSICKYRIDNHEGNICYRCKSSRCFNFGKVEKEKERKKERESDVVISLKDNTKI